MSNTEYLIRKYGWISGIDGTDKDGNNFQTIQAPTSIQGSRNSGYTISYTIFQNLNDVNAAGYYS